MAKTITSLQSGRAHDTAECQREAAQSLTDQPVTLESVHALLQKVLVAIDRIPNGHATPSNDVRSMPVVLEDIPAPLAPSVMTLDEHWYELGVTAKRAQTGPSSEHLHDVAKFLGDNYSLLEPWYQTVKRAFQHGQHARLDVTKQSRDTIDAICRLNRLLYDFGLATEAVYLRQPYKRVRLTPHIHPNTINFLLGGWLEDYVRHQLTVSTGYGTIERNLLVQVNQGQQVELDIVWYAPSTMAIVECKTSDYQASLPRLQLISQYLRPTHLYVVTLHKPSREVVQQCAQAYGIRLITLQDVPRVLARLAHPQPTSTSLVTEGRHP